uniref:Periplasmic protein involved in polysaccharide export-like protein n=1 Tax=Chlorobium chlorochromatii (strain CaD3) TaxID=340177 RepID=Q3ASV4_CHLCH
MRQHRLFLHLFFVGSLALLLNGCASYRNLPAGSHQHITAKPNSTISREAVVIADPNSSQDSSYKPSDYRVGPNDVLYVNVSGKPEFIGTAGGSSSFKGYRVDGRGYIYLPIAGKVSVAGLPMYEVRQKIQEVMRRYFNDPWVVVEIAEYRTRQIFVFGAVKKPGPQVIPSLGINIAQALASADVQNSGQNYKKIRIIRSLSPTEGELLVVDFDSVLHGRSLPMQLQEGDIVYVPKSTLASWNTTISELLPSLQAFSAVLQPFVNIKYLQD